MKKSLVALAALAATTAFAQSSVTLYGNIDQSVYRTSYNKDYTLSSNSNGGSTSLWGITGTEDLGGGTKASFDLKSELTLASGQTGSGSTGLAAGSGSAEVFNRGAWIGLSNAGMGDFKIGRQNDPWWETGTQFNNTGINSFGWALATAAVSGTSASQAVPGGAVGLSLASLSAGSGVASSLGSTPGTITSATTGFPQNPSFVGTGAAFKTGISYATPTIMGVTGKIYKSVPKAAYNISTETLAATAYSLNYKNGPLTASWATTDLNDATNASVIKQTLMGVKYVTGPYTLTAAQNRTRLGTQVTAAQAHDADVVALGVGYAVNAKWNLDFGYTTLKDKVDSANKFTQTAAVAKYAFSKRTSWYVGYGRGKNEGASRYTTIYAGAGYDPTANVAATDTSIITGIKHAF